MTTDAPLTDDECQSIVDALESDDWDPRDKTWTAFNQVLSARLDALHAENAELRASRQRLMEESDRLLTIREAERDALRDENTELRRYVEPFRQSGAVRLLDERDAVRAERDALHAKLRARENDVDRLIDERDALRDAITELADEADRESFGASIVLADDLRALLSEAGERP